MTEYISVQWVDPDTKEIIFEDCMSVRKFKRIHGVSPHVNEFGKPCGVVIHSDDVRRDS